MKIEKIDINDIKPYVNNAKLHPAQQIEQIKKSILEFGNNDPIAIDENNIIIEGHGRYLALKELGYKEVEVIKLSHLSEDKKKAYILVHNKLTMNTGFDIDILNEELADIESIDMSQYDFNIDIEIEIEEKDDFEDLSSKVKETYEVIIECNDEAMQERVFEKLESEGYKCRVLTL